MQRMLGLASVSASMLLLAQPFRAMADEDEPDNGSFLYVMTNAAAGNTVLVFRRNADGTLTKAQEVPTQGLGSGGTGDPLGSQGALTLNGDGRLLLAVDAGSNEISALAVTDSGLQFVSKAWSGGTKPVSVAVDGDVAYVLNAGGTPNVTAFRIGLHGELQMIANSARVLPGGANSAPAQVGVSRNDEVLVVTEKNTNKIDLFPLDDSGHMANGSSVASDGGVPFGFAFGADGTLVVSEAAASTFSSYSIHSVENNPTLQTITKSLPDMGAAACWIVTSHSGELAFASNSANHTISSLSVSSDGMLHVLSAVAANTGAGTVPTDLTLTGGGGFLYVISTSNGELKGYRVQNGALSQVASVTGLPVSIQGIAAR
ncbi:MAG: beta-propeller fold lactonase family protein [Bryobacteraceae bacterium]